MTCDDCQRLTDPPFPFCEHDPAVIARSQQLREELRERWLAEGKSEQYVDELFAKVDSWPPIPHETARAIAQLLRRA